MKIKDMVNYLSKLDQEAEVLVADYYYSDREGFKEEPNAAAFMARAIVSARNYNKQYNHNYYEESSYLLDQRGVL